MEADGVEEAPRHLEGPPPVDSEEDEGGEADDQADVQDVKGPKAAGEAGHKQVFNQDSDDDEVDGGAEVSWDEDDEGGGTLAGGGEGGAEEGRSQAGIVHPQLG